MKILYPIGTYFPSQEGGPSNTIYWMAKALCQIGHYITVITTTKGAKQVEPDKWLDTKYGHVIYYTTRFHYFPRNLLRCVSREIKTCDVVHLNSIFYPPSLFSALIARRAKKPVIWSPRGELSELALIYHSWRKRPYLKLIRSLLGSHIIFHSTSAEETRQIRNELGQTVKIVEIPNYIEMPLKITHTKAHSYFLFIGRIHPVKAIENLIRALSYSSIFNKSNYFLKIAGDNNNTYGEELKILTEQLGLDQKIEFIGHVESQEKQELYACAYFTILPSHSENFGNVVLESLSQGTPAIASKGTPWEVLEKDNAGFWVSNHPEELSKIIETVIQLSETEYLSYRNGAFNMAKERFDIAQNISIWEKTYQSLIN